MPGLTLVMRWLDGLHQYQFIQTAADAVTARLDVDAGFALSDAEVLAYLRSKIADEITWTVVRGKPERTQNGKVLIIRNDWRRATWRRYDATARRHNMGAPPSSERASASAVAWRD